MSDDYAFYRDQTIKLIRQDGANQARLDGHDEAIERIEKAVTDGFANLERRTAEQINHIRGEIKQSAEATHQEIKQHTDGLYTALDEIKQERASFSRALGRVAAAIILAVIAAAAANYAAISPQVADMTARAIGQLN